MAKEVLSSNNNTFEVTSDIAPVFTRTISSGFNNERKDFTISFRSKRDIPITIGSLSVTAADNKRFSKSPKLIKNKANKYATNAGILERKLKSVTKDSNGNITSYLYDLIYTPKGGTRSGNSLRYDITNRARTIITPDTGIRSVEFDSNLLYSGGSTKQIKIYGVPNTEFEIIISKITDIFNSDGDIIDSTEESILSNDKTATSTITLGDGTKYTSLKQKTNSKGYYYINQRFPKTTTKTRYAVNLKNSNISTKFKTERWLLNRDKWSGWYSRIITQYVPVTLTLRATTTSSSYTIDKNSSGSFATWNSSTPADLTYKGNFRKRNVGKRDVSGNYNSNFTVTYVIKTTGAEISLKTGENEGVPVFEITKSSIADGSSTLSDWSNSIPNENGGTLLEMSNIGATISTSSTSNDTITITFDVIVEAWGTKDVTMALDTDTIFNRA